MNKRTLDYAAIGLRLQAARQEKNITQRELAGFVGVSTSYIGHLERGLKRGSLDVMVSLCFVLDLGMDALLFGIRRTPDRNAIVRDYLRQQLSELEGASSG